MQYLRNVSRFAVAAALAAGLAVAVPAAYAQSSDGLPEASQQGDVSFVSGGIGKDQSTAFERNEAAWPLALRFTGKGGEYLADVHVRIVDGKGTELLKTDARGPYMLVKLPPGRYTVHASYQGSDETRAVTVGAKGGAKAAFQWSAQ
ncbi:carboxypeptidase regulatory-like domain-containing protein [Burkholderia sp. AU19243]|uniref:carboxypeptidase-like regulatory domain-containing protein n=1 Tax=Burkholderia TaxID=32008 RepID=UPI001B994847|nr:MULTISPECIES: carboxypeptidase-like regulatory domain-containing protein [Burkholderia]MBR7964468.1 carboxypeptidase regulatory-like domain-containing protein [Burkholderia vietnamiensis]MBR8146090.1 carboxypeptidase regulatory-like domain-containing protein [Burkholderia vietnamiensis]MBR8362925.1 carboxypeptidase regulatory-like domain-containing protein [Burkholderia sp. AU19243]MBY4697066.1 carboxypeptidase-like regulatory domain-containing protein [Burkholderia latens]